MRDLTFRFPSEEAAKEFAVWLCESGEQHYWDWMEYQLKAGRTDQIVSFNYFPDEDENSDVEFIQDWTIRTELIESEQD